MKLIDPFKEGRERVISGIYMFFLVLIFFLFVRDGFIKERSREDFREIAFPKIALKPINRGSFALVPRATAIMRGLFDDLIFIGVNNRPDQSKISKIYLGFKSSGSRKETEEGKRLFVSNNHGEHKFVEESTDLAVTAFLDPMDKNSLLLSLEASGFEKESLKISLSSFAASSLDKENYIKPLQDARFWAPDLLISQWKGKRYNELVEKSKVEIGGKIFFLGIGDLLCWNDENWELASARSSKPMAQLASVNPKSVEFQVWDGTGYSSSLVTVSIGKSVDPPLILNQLLSSVRPRSPSEISCRWGGKRVVVKEGDWWFKNGYRWYPSRSLEEMDSIVYHRILGELFVVDKIEQRKGKVILKGSAFNPMRTELFPIYLSFDLNRSPAIHPRSDRSIPTTSPSSEEKGCILYSYDMEENE